MAKSHKAVRIFSWKVNHVYKLAAGNNFGRRSLPLIRQSTIKSEYYVAGQGLELIREKSYYFLKRRLQYGDFTIGPDNNYHIILNKDLTKKP